MLYSTMPLNAKSFWSSLEKIMISRGLSLNEVAIASDIQYKSLNLIKNGVTKTVHHATIRSIAKALNLKFEIKGNNVTFTELPTHENLPSDLAQLLEIYNKLNHEGKQQLLKIAGVLCLKVDGMEIGEGKNN